MLPFTAEIYFALVAQVYDTYPAALPLALVAMVLAAGLAFWTGGGGGPALAGRIVTLLLAAGWAATGWLFHIEQFATINFMAPVYGGAFLLQAALLVWLGVLRGAVTFRWPGGVRGWTAAALAVLALAGWPLLDAYASPAAGTLGWGAVRVAGLTPGPTALLTLALLMLAHAEGRRWPVWALAAIPLIWAAVWGWHAWELGLVADWLLVVGAFALVSLRIGIVPQNCCEN